LRATAAETAAKPETAREEATKEKIGRKKPSIKATAPETAAKPETAGAEAVKEKTGRKASMKETAAETAVKPETADEAVEAKTRRKPSIKATATETAVKSDTAAAEVVESKTGRKKPSMKASAAETAVKPETTAEEAVESKTGRKKPSMKATAVKPETASTKSIQQNNNQDVQKEEPEAGTKSENFPGQAEEPAKVLNEVVDRGGAKEEHKAEVVEESGAKSGKGTPRCGCYKTFSVRNLQTFGIS